MKDNARLNEESLKRRRSSAQKVSELENLLASRQTKGLKRNSKSEMALSLSMSDLANNLFSKAPIEFLENKSLEQLCEITDQCAEYLDLFNKEKKKLVVGSFSSQNGTAIISVIGDRPFIVNSLSECLEACGYRIKVLLHPILVVDGFRTSVTYIEVDALDKEQTAYLVKQTQSTLSDLVLATDDFTSMLVRCETLAKVLENPTYRTKYTQTEKREVAEFLRWLTDGSYIFLGYSEWRVDDSEQIESLPFTQHGVMKTSQAYKDAMLEEIREDCNHALISNEPIHFTKLRSESLVHRRMSMLNILIPEFSTDGHCQAIHSITGLLTSKALAQESSSIPIIRRKLQKLIEIEEVVHNSHDYKYIVDIIDRMPKDQALRLDVDNLRAIVGSIIGLQNKNETRVSLRFDSSRRGACVLVVMPRERFNTFVRSEIQQYVEELFAAPKDSSEYHLDLSNKPLARFYFYVPLASKEIPDVDVGRIAAQINDLSHTWQEKLEERIASGGIFTNPGEIIAKYGEAFAEDYQALQTIDESIEDIKFIEELNAQNRIAINFSASSDHNKSVESLTVYSYASEVSISKVFPVLENAGLEVISEKAARVAPANSADAYVHRYIVRSKNTQKIDTQNARLFLCPGLTEVILGKAENDCLNSLLLEAGLNIRAISLIRTYCYFLWHISTFATKVSIFEAFSSVPAAAQEFWRMFSIRFDPNVKLSIDEREREFKIRTNAYIDILRDVSDLNRDRILRRICNLLEHTVRTNFYQDWESIAIKIESVKVELMPSPRPKFEIFISSPTFEGVHLRAGTIARGGLRWSDRLDDFRSEVLGLVKTQNIKNAVIVPNGAKGGFVIRNLPKDSDAARAAVENTYKNFIRSLLSVTDNKVGNKIVPPEKVVRYDCDDPYLVVAADKGTATFSDLANKVAADEFNFWLGDAFASGGSVGYDHKKYAITAKGAWECAKRHFNNLGVDYVNNSFTAIGIGDMAGDVFGNGLLLSRQYKLLAAFNHKHIFLDPNPDPEISFNERQRLFNLPRSQWTDYKSELISAGGGVYDRFDKEIVITPEVKEALSLSEDVPDKVSGETLITYILKADVDLLWNGGIGTYVKSSAETHAEVNDGTNDRVRINADELRAKVVAEGGNLGFTQRARIQFAKLGGRLNTDAIDNSAGVDLSDHEVNLKILCAALIKAKKLTLAERDKLLLEVAPQVIESVLQHNKNQATLLSIGTLRSYKSIDYYKSLARLLQNLGYINRRLEWLPDDDDLSDRALKRKGLTSPELAVFLAGVKMWTKDVILESQLANDPTLHAFLLDYFPAAIREKFKNEILDHALAKNIIASQVANTLIDSVGITFLHRMCITHSTRPIVVVKCLLAAQIILQTQTISRALERFDNFSDNSIFLKLRHGEAKTLRDATSWMISYHGESLELQDIVKLYEKSYNTLLANADDVFLGENRELYFERLEEYRNLKLDDFCARSLAVAPNVVSVFEMLWASKKSGKNIRTVAMVFSMVMDTLRLNTPVKLRDNSDTALSKWEHQLVLSSVAEIRRCISLLTCELLSRNLTERKDVNAALQNSPSYEELISIIEEVSDANISAAALSIISRHMSSYKLA